MKLHEIARLFLRLLDVLRGTDGVQRRAATGIHQRHIRPSPEDALEDGLAAAQILPLASTTRALRHEM